MKVSSGVSDSKLNILFYAPPGVGKTFLAGTALEVPSLGNVLFLDVDQGLLAVKHHGDKIKSVPITSSASFEEAIVELAGPKGAAYQTVVVDSVSELAAIALQEVMAAAVAKGGRRDNVDQSELLDFKVSGQKLLRLLGMAKRLPQTVIFTAKEQRVVPQDANGLPIPGAKPTEIFPSMPKKVRTELAGFVDLVGWLSKDADGVTRTLYTQAKGPVLAKNRIAGLAAEIANPHMRDLFPTTNKKEGK